MRILVYMIVLLTSLLALSGCGVVEGKGEAEKVAQAMFEARIKNGWAGSDQYYSDLFRKRTNGKKWADVQRLVTSAMGELRSYSLNSWKVQSGIKTNDLSGTIVVLVYQTQYEKGKGTETVTVHKPLMGKKYVIVGHNIDSDKIRQLIDKGIRQVVSEGRTL